MTRLVSELTGADLALWVARAEGLDAEVRSYEMADGRHYYCNVRTLTRSYPFSPHEDWAQGGPLIEKLKIDIECANIIKHLMSNGTVFGGPDTNHDTWRAGINGEHHQLGTLPLLAAMRARVASVYGDTVPDEVAP